MKMSPIFPFLMAWALFACAGDPAKLEAKTLVTAVDAYRAAENPDKASAAKGVRDAACTARDVCDAKTACLAAIEPMVSGLALSQEAQQGLDDLEAKRLAPDDPRARALPQKAKDAELLIAKSHDAMPACEEKVIALRVKYDVVPQGSR
jgi:hypothetical protein